MLLQDYLTNQYYFDGINFLGLGVNFTFYVPRKNDTSDLRWKSLEERDSVVKNVMKLKKKYPNFILNNFFLFCRIIIMPQ